MLIKNTQDIAALLACPACAGPLIATRSGDLVCSAGICRHAEEPFDMLSGQKVLVDFDRSVLEREALIERDGASVTSRGDYRILLRRIVDGTNRQAPHYAREIIRELERLADDRGRPSTLLVLAGGEIGSGAHALYTSDKVQIIALDLYASPHTTFIADAHAIPLQDASVDAVWAQAIMEYLVEPERVVAEIKRVLKPEGLLFSNIAFMWPVCEGAYDYRRFTASGLRWLFRDFDVLALGASSGPGTMAALAIRYLAQSLLGSHKLGQIAAFPFVWLRVLDRWCRGRRALDASAALFLYGRMAREPINEKDLVDFYEIQNKLKSIAMKP